MKSKIPIVNAQNIPQSLKDLPYWRVWFAKPKKNKSGLDKLPTITGRSLLKGWGEAKHDLSFDDAYALYLKLELERKGGIGIRIAPEGKFTALDFDHTRNPKDAIDNTYTEFSPSGNGIRQFVFGRAKGDCSNNDTGVEVYAGYSTRFVTVTGNRKGPHKIIRKGAALANSLYKKHRKLSTHKLSKDTPPCPNLSELPDVDVEHLGVNSQIKDSITTGDASYYGNEHADRSAMLMGVASSLHNTGLTPEQILSVLISNPCNQKAVEQSRDRNSAARWLWRYCVVPAVGDIKVITPAAPRPEKSTMRRVKKHSYEFPVQIAEDIRQYIDGRMLRHQPEFTAAAALVFLSALHGRHYKGAVKETRLNLYSFLVGPPGASKTEPLTALKTLCGCCTEAPVFYAERIGSPEGMEDVMFNHKRVLWLWEEAGKRLGHSVGKGAQTHLAAIPDMIVTLYSASNSAFTRRHTANRKGEQEMTVDKPFLSIIGVMTTSELSNMLGHSMLGGGFASRVLISKSPNKLPPMRDDYLTNGIPKHLKKYIYSRSHISKTQGGAGKPKEDILIHESKTVTELFRKFRERQEKAVDNSSNENEQYLRVRGEENARRVSCILAATVDGSRPRITEAIARWSIKFVGRNIEYLVDETEFYTGGESTPYTDQRARVLRILSRASDYAGKRPKFKEQLEAGMMPKSILIQNSNMKSQDLEGVLKTLTESNEVGYEKIEGVAYYWLGDPNG